MQIAKKVFHAWEFSITQNIKDRSIALSLWLPRLKENVTSTPIVKLPKQSTQDEYHRILKNIPGPVVGQLFEIQKCVIMKYNVDMRI